MLSRWSLKMIGMTTARRAFGRINGEGRCIVYTVTASTLRLISFRRAHEKEMRRYE
jgi:uncharacterized DUF497 family protein